MCDDIAQTTGVFFYGSYLRSVFIPMLTNIPKQGTPSCDV